MTVNVWKLARSAEPLERGSADLLPIALADEIAGLDGASARLPGGAYTTFRTYRSRCALRLEDHFQRLAHTAELSGRPVVLDRAGLRAALRRLVSALPEGEDLRFRITVDLDAVPGEVYIASEPLRAPPVEAYASGALAITCDLQRRLPEAKLTRFIEKAGQVRQGLPPGVNEALMVDPHGFLREGLSSNFFAVRAGGLWTADEGVLCGVTRATVLDCAARLGVSVTLQPVALADLAALEEAFITSASRGVLPLRRIDQTALKAGAPGPVTRRILQAFNAAIDQEIEPI